MAMQIKETHERLTPVLVDLINCKNVCHTFMTVCRHQVLKNGNVSSFVGPTEMVDTNKSDLLKKFGTSVKRIR